MGCDLSEYQDALKSLFARVTGATKLGLERTQQLLDALGNPHKQFPSIHVAGTNGKGSVVATLDALLRSRGLRVGRYTSPHLVDFRERIVVNGVQITEDEVMDFLGGNQEFAERIGATFFELTTALAFRHFARSHVDIAVIETGLGGRLDSTNVINPLASVVTSIGLDHTELLGETLEQVAFEKAGIFKAGAAAIIGEPSPGIRALLAARGAEVGASRILVLDDEVQIGIVDVDSSGTTFDISGVLGAHRVATPLAGAHQARNTVLALLALNTLGEEFAVAPEDWNHALTNIRLAGRFQRFEKYIFDVAHNPDGARALAATIEAVSPDHPRTALVAVLGDKDWKGIMRALIPAVDRLFITVPPGAPAGREFDADGAYEYAVSQGWSAELDTNFDDAITRLSKRCGTIVITGSFHTVGAAMQRLQRSPATA